MDHASADVSAAALGVLSIYVAICVAAGAWATFANLPDLAKEIFPGLSDADLSFLLNTNTVAQVLTVPVAVWLLTRPKGLRYTIIVGSVGLALNQTLWVLACILPRAFRESYSSRILLCMGSACGGAAAAFLQGCPSQVSAVWFPPAHRGRATATGYLAPYFGTTLSYLIGYLITTESQLRCLVYSEAAVFTAMCVIPMVWFPNSPTASAAVRESDKALLQEVEVTTPCELTVTDSLWKVVRNRSCLLLIISAGALNGAYTQWQGLQAIIFNDLDDPRYTEDDGNLLGFISGLGFTVGGFIGGWLADRCFQKRLKLLLVLSYAPLIAAFISLLLLLPSPLRPDAHVSYGILVVVISVTGITAGATMPPALELLAEITFPVPEGATGNISMLVNQFGAVVVAALPAVSTSPKLVNTFMAGMLLACGLCLLPVKEVHKRREAARLLQSEPE